jgi:hypothetical protein
VDGAKIAELRERCQILKSSHETPRASESNYLGIIAPLLEHEGYTIESMRSQRDRGLDLVARRSIGQREEVVGAEFTHRREQRPVTGEILKRAIALGNNENLDQLMLVANRSFSSAVIDSAGREAPVKIKLLDLDALLEWIERVAATVPDAAHGILDLTKDFLIRAVRELAKDPTEARHLEWRMVEHLLGEVFGGLGFEVSVTPATGDGGKDTILHARLASEDLSYFVELKHWFSKKVGPGACPIFCVGVRLGVRRGVALRSGSRTGGGRGPSL